MTGCLQFSGHDLQPEITVWDSTLPTLVDYLGTTSWSYISYLKPALKTGRTADDRSVQHAHP